MVPVDKASDEMVLAWCQLTRLLMKHKASHEMVLAWCQLTRLLMVLEAEWGVKSFVEVERGSRLNFPSY